MRVGILTGGGDCPGLNPVIRGAVRVICNAGGEVYGLLEGWRGAIEGNYIELNSENTDDIIFKGGTILGSSRTNPYKNEKVDVPKVIATIKDLELDCLIAIGGDDTLGVANKLWNDHKLPVIGCPKTIDNDLSSTDVTFGFDTSINTVMEAVDRLRTTAESHRRVMVVETMGRHAGWIALFSGLATAADYTLVPEVEIDMDRMVEVLKKRRANGKMYGIVIVSEGAQFNQNEGVTTQDGEVDDFGHVKLGGIGETVAKLIEERTGFETRHVTLGHLQRGGSPSAYDRVLGTRCGVHAGWLALKHHFGYMVALRGTQVVPVALADAVGEMRALEPNFLEEADVFLQ